MNTILEALNWRYAVKKFSDKKIPQDKIDTIFEALRLTPSSLGMQAWKFVNVENTELREKLVAASWNQEQITQASHLLVLTRPDSVNEDDAKKWVNYSGEQRQMEKEKMQQFEDMIIGYLSSISEEEKNIWMDKQLYIALGNLMTVCAVEGVDACPMEGIVKDEYDKILGLNDKGLKTVVVCPIGYRAEDDLYQQMPKVRYPQEDVFLTI